MAARSSNRLADRSNKENFLGAAIVWMLLRKVHLAFCYSFAIKQD